MSKVEQIPAQSDAERMARKLEELAQGVRDGDGFGAAGLLILSMDADGDGTTKVFYPAEAAMRSMSLVGMMEDLKFELLKERYDERVSPGGD